MVGMVIRNLAREGNVVIAGRGGQVLLQDMPRALHVQVVAPFDHRVAVLARREGIAPEEASRIVGASDRTRRDYLRKYHRVDWLDPTLYDLVINTRKIPASLAAAMIVDAYQELPAQDHD
ncbi:MAG TPA: cytidylate kinase-like family protein [Anaerolineae bacterium]|nr:cytidylate kinase-like family protein [Anaerolineae bacterium]